MLHFADIGESNMAEAQNAAAISCCAFCGMPKISGSHREVEPHLPIPNRTVKHFFADGSAGLPAQE